METKLIYLYGIGEFNVYVGLLIKLFTAVVCGLAIGLDRESRHKSAGVRTNILISVGAMLYTSTSLLNIEDTAGPPVDPNRVMAQIVSGIGFLGAGSIIQSRGSIIGLTTAASIWVVAALGAAAGSGYVLQATVFALVVVLILKNSSLLSRLIPSHGHERLYTLQTMSIGRVLEELDANLEFDRFQIHSKAERVVDESRNLILSTIILKETSKNMIRITRKCRRLVNVEKVSFVHFRAFDREDEDEDDPDS